MIGYKDLMMACLTEGKLMDTRAGKAVVIFNQGLEMDLTQGFPIVTTRKINYRQGFGELAAFIHGERTKEGFRKYGCTYWETTGDNDDLGPIYGALWRYWPTGDVEEHDIDQLAELVKGLKQDPGSRRHVLTTWNPSVMPIQALPPCHLIAQWHVDEGLLHCSVYMRSVDLMLGLPFDIIVYAGLTELLAKECGYRAGSMAFFFANAHIYANHVKNAFTQLAREPYQMAKLISTCDNIFGFLPEHFTIENYKSHDRLEYPLNL
jgi:thymidylate synthase